MFGLGAKSKEKKAKKELEKLEKKEAKVKEKLAKLEEKQRKKEEKKGKKSEVEPAPPKPVIYKFNVAGIEPHINIIRFELMSYNPDFHEAHEDGDYIYKYVGNVSQLDLIEEDGKIQVIADKYPIGFVPEDKLEDVRQFLSDHPDGDKYCTITGGEFKAYEGRRAVKGTDDYCVTVYLRYFK